MAREKRHEFIDLAETEDADRSHGVACCAIDAQLRSALPEHISRDTIEVIGAAGEMARSGTDRRTVLQRAGAWAVAGGVLSLAARGDLAWAQAGAPAPDADAPAPEPVPTPEPAPADGGER